MPLTSRFEIRERICFRLCWVARMASNPAPTNEVSSVQFQKSLPQSPVLQRHSATVAPSPTFPSQRLIAHSTDQIVTVGTQEDMGARFNRLESFKGSGQFHFSCCCPL